MLTRPRLQAAIEYLGTDAYGAQIGRYLSEKLRRDVTAPQVYMTLERLAKRGLLSVAPETSHIEGAGRHWRPTDLGQRFLNDLIGEFLPSRTDV